MNRIKQVNLIFLLTILIIMIAPAFPFSRITTNNATLMLLSQVLLATPSMLYLVYYRRDHSYEDQGIVGKPKWKVLESLSYRKVKPWNVILLILLTYCLLPVINLVNSLSRLFSVNRINDTVTSISNNNSFFYALFCIAVVPAVLEEFVYRGVFYQEYRKAKPFAAMFLSAFLFGILHGNVNQFIYAFVMGVIFALVIEATDSILSTMIMHFVFNANSVVLLYAMPETFESMDNAELSSMTALEVIGSFGVAALVGMVLSVLIYRKIAKNSGRLEHIKKLFQRRTIKEKENASHIKLVTFSLGATIIFCVTIIVLNELQAQGLPPFS